MCRLIAYAGAPVTLAHLVFSGTHSLYEQSWAPRQLLTGTVNADGYGVAWYARGRPARIAEARPIWYDSDLPDTLAAISSGCALAALRNATVGIPVDRSAVAPFVLDQWTFVLNGYVPDFRLRHMRALRQTLPDDLYGRLRGVSDGETLFLLAVAALREGATLTEALEAAARPVHERVGGEEAQLNMVLSDGERLAAIRSSTVLLTNSLYLAERPPFAPDGVVIASEAPESGAAWQPVDGHSVVEICRDGSVTSQAVFF